MKAHRILLAAALLSTLSCGPAPAAAQPLTYSLPDETAELRPGPGPGFEAAQNNCLACHSADYPNTQPPHRGAAFWNGEVTKMIKVYRAPIGDADAKAIADYLARTY